MAERDPAQEAPAQGRGPAVEDTLGAFVPNTRVFVPGATVGPLAGLRFAAKDIFDVAGHVTGCGNPDWARSHGPATAHAAAVQALLEAGADLVANTITDELAYSLGGQNVHYGTPSNVNAPGRICGGSSCGSASAVAGGLVDVALGSDTGGSVRVPASYCGLFGLRPTHGRIPLDGVMPLAPSFDTVGWFAREAALLRRVGEVLLGEAGSEARPFGRLLLAQDAFDLAEAPIRLALAPLVEGLEARLGKAEPVTVGEPGGGLDSWMWQFRRIQGYEVWRVHGAWIEAVKPRFGPEIAERFDWARAVTAEEAAAASRARQDFAARLAGLLEGAAVLCLPTAPGIAPPVGASAEAMAEHRSRTLSLTSIAGLARLPQVTLPLARVEGCPVGLSLIGAQGSDLGLLVLAEAMTAELAVSGRS